MFQQELTQEQLLRVLNDPNATKHVGYFSNTATRVAVIYPYLPDDKRKAVVVETDSLIQRLRDPLISILSSSDARQSNKLYEVLNVHRMPDTGRTILQELHYGGYLRPVSVSDVVLSPMPNCTFPLSQYNRDILGVQVLDAPAPMASVGDDGVVNIAGDDGSRNLAAVKQTVPPPPPPPPAETTVVPGASVPQDTTAALTELLQKVSEQNERMAALMERLVDRLDGKTKKTSSRRSSKTRKTKSGKRGKPGNSSTGVTSNPPSVSP